MALAIEQGMVNSDATHILIASAQNTSARKVANLFDTVATNGSGAINKAQFVAALQKMSPPQTFNTAQAEALFTRADPGATGSVSKSDFVAAVTTALKEIRAGHPTRDNANAQQTAQAAQNNAQIDAASNPAFDIKRIGRLFNAFA